MKKITVSILTTLLMLSMVFSSSVFAAEKEVSAWDSFLGLFSAKTAATSDVGVEYRGHIQNIGNYPLDGSWIQGPEELGTEGKGLRLEGFWIQLDGDVPAGAHIEYQVHVQNVGWMDPVQDGDFAGTEGKSQQIEAIKISLVDDEGVQLEDYSVVYTGHVQNKGDVGPYTNGEQLGTDGEFLRLEAITVEIVQNPADLTEYEEALAAVTQADYTAASWTAYQAVVNANVVTEDNLISEVEEATAAITAAQANLVKVLKVESVSAISAKQLQVVFTAPVDANSFINSTTKLLANTPMTLTRIPAATNANNTVDISLMTTSLATDGKTLTLTAAGATFFEGTYSLTVSDVVKTTTGDKCKVYSGTFVASDKTAPTIKSVTSSTAGTTATSAKVVFTEPVKAGTAILIDGAYVGVTTAADNITINGLSLAASQSHTLSILNLTDAAGNVTATASQAFTISSDATAPTIASVEQYSDSSVLVTFDKAMDTTTLIAANVKMTDVNLVAIGNVAITAYDTTTTTTNTKFIVSTDSKTFYGLATTKAIKLAFTNNIKDSLGNKLVAEIKDFTLTKDNNKPTVTNITYETTAGKLTNVVLEFSEQLNTVPAKWAVGNITMVDSNGIDQSGNFFSAANSTYTLSTDKKKVSVLVDPALTAGATVMPNTVAKGVYTVNINSGVFTDLSVVGNTNAAASKTIDFGTPASGSFAVQSATSNNNVITVTYPVAVKGGAVTGSATDGANYTVAGKSLAGASIVLDSAQKVATITIPSEFITTSNSAAIFTVNNVLNASSEVVTPFTGTLAVIDNVKPVLVSALQTAFNKVELTYSEDLTTLTAAQVGKEFVLAQDGTIVTGLDAGTATNILATRDASNFKKVVVTLSGTTANSVGGTITKSNAASSTLTVNATAATVMAPTNIVLKVTAIDVTNVPTHLAVSTDGGLTFGAPTALATINTDKILGVDTLAFAAGTTVVGDTYSFTVTPAINASNNLTIITKNDATPVMKDVVGNSQVANTTIQVTK